MKNSFSFRKQRQIAYFFAFSLDLFISKSLENSRLTEELINNNPWGIEIEKSLKCDKRFLFSRSATVWHENFVGVKFNLQIGDFLCFAGANFYG